MNYVKFSVEGATRAAYGSGNFGENQRYESTKTNLDLSSTTSFVCDTNSKRAADYY